MDYVCTNSFLVEDVCLKVHKEELLVDLLEPLVINVEHAIREAELDTLSIPWRGFDYL